MKKSIFKILILAALVASCSDDDVEVIPEAEVPETEEPAQEEEQEDTTTVGLASDIIINEVQYGSGNFVELLNTGEGMVDLSDFWFCLGPGQYSQIGGITPESGSTSLEAGAFVVLPYDMPDVQGGLGLYSTNSFTSADAMVGFVQWGAAGAARENIAIEAGLWTAGEFVPTVQLESYSIEFDGEGNSANDWAQEVNPSLGEANDVLVSLTTFNVTISNVMNYFSATSFAQPVGASANGPLTSNGAQYQVSFQAVPGAKLTPVTMMGNSNDWFLAPTDLAGIDLWENGTALNGVDIASKLSLYDAGTEADNDPASFPPAGANVGDADPNTSVRLVDGRPTGEAYMTAVLDYAAGTAESAGTFTLTITAIDAANFVITPGLAVVHALPEPLFTLGEADRGFGLEAIAEDGMPGELWGWFNEEGQSGAPLRLSSSISVFSPGLVYAFNTDSDPLVKQGEENNPANGLAELAEDGNNGISIEYLSNLGLPAVASNETAPVGPGGALTFSIEVPAGQNYKFGYATMLVNTNDWFLAYNNAGFPLWDENGSPVSGTGASEKSYLYDSGTEIDEPVGFGIFQAPRQGGPNEGPADQNTTVRRVSELEDVQFGKGLISSGPGVVYLQDPRGGYNLVRVEIQAQ